MEKKETSQRESESMDFEKYYVGYNAMMLAMKDDDIREGLQKALYLIKIHMNAEDIVLFEYDEEDGDFKHIINQSKMENNSTMISYILNQLYTKENDSKRKALQLGGNKLKGIIFQPIETKYKKYILAITNAKMEESNHLVEFMELLKDLLDVILRRLEHIKQLEKSSTIDSLTDLKNRNEFEKRMIELDQTKEPCVFTIMDLFQLKHINDFYSHDMGDKYIHETANILKKYFPMAHKEVSSSGKIEKKDTGTEVYRIGGDEFVIISTTEQEESIRLKCQMAQEEVRNLRIGQSSEDPIGMDYGATTRMGEEPMKEAYIRSDEELKAAKAKKYKELKIERRK